MTWRESDTSAADFEPPDSLHAADMEDRRYTLHFFRVWGAATHHMDGTAVDVLTEYVGWKSEAVSDRYLVCRSGGTNGDVKGD